jgi:hypothetical protein
VTIPQRPARSPGQHWWPYYWRKIVSGVLFLAAVAAIASFIVTDLGFKPPWLQPSPVNSPVSPGANEASAKSLEESPPPLVRRKPAPAWMRPEPKCHATVLTLQNLSQQPRDHATFQLFCSTPVESQPGTSFATTSPRQQHPTDVSSFSPPACPPKSKTAC